MTLRLHSLFRSASTNLQFGDDPLRFLRVALGVLLLAATAVALLLALTGAEPRALLLVGAFWALYGLFTAFIGGVLEPLIDTSADMFASVGLSRAGGGFSEVETLVVRGNYAAAAEAYRKRAGRPRDRIEATVRRAALLAGPLDAPEVAVSELAALRAEGRSLSPNDDVRVGLALVDLYDFRLQQPGRAMAELRGIIDRHPDSRHARLMRDLLGRLKQNHFGSEYGGTAEAKGPSHASP